MTDNAELKDALTRTIVLMYGLLENGEQYWIYASVKPSKYQTFLAAQKAGTLNVHDFAPYGEIIVSGTGKAPPDEVTLKVAEMYQTDPGKLMPQAEEETADKK